MSALTNGIGSQHLTPGESTSMLVQPATCDPVAPLRAPAASGFAARRIISQWLNGPKTVISGIVRDVLGAVVSGATVVICGGWPNAVVRGTVTGGGVVTTPADGTYGFEMNDQTPSVVLANKAGASDVSGMTDINLVGA